MFLEATDENDGSKLSDEEVRDNITTFFLAGSETTAVTMAWTLIQLSQVKF